MANNLTLEAPIDKNSSMNMTPGEIIQHQIERLGKTREWFKSQMKVSQKTVFNWIHNEPAIPRARVADAARVLQITENQLEGREPLPAMSSAVKTNGKNPGKKSLASSDVALDYNAPFVALREIPVISKTAAGDPVELVDSNEPGFAEEYIPNPDPHITAPNGSPLTKLKHLFALSYVL